MTTKRLRKCVLTLQEEGSLEGGSEKISKTLQEGVSPNTDRRVLGDAHFSKIRGHKVQTVQGYISVQTVGGEWGGTVSSAPTFGLF